MDRIRDADFAARLDRACSDHQHCPTDAHRGKQKWLREELPKFSPDLNASAEAVRKWFAGETRPRPNKMRAIAHILNVDEAWLSLGIIPDMSPKEKKRRSRSVEGGAMLLAGLIQISGAHSTFPSPGDIDRADLQAIIDGEAVELDAPLARARESGTMLFTIKRRHEQRKVIGIVPSGFGARLFLITQIVISSHAVRRGDYFELEASFLKGHLMIGTSELPEVTSLEMLVAQ